VEILKYALMNEANKDVMTGVVGIKDPSKKPSADDEDEEDDVPRVKPVPTPKTSTPTRGRKRSAPEAASDEDEGAEVISPLRRQKRKTAPAETAPVEEEPTEMETEAGLTEPIANAAEVRVAIASWLRNRPDSSGKLTELYADLGYPRAVIKAVLNQLAEENGVMIDESGMVILI